jgi:hypothetical protein
MKAVMILTIALALAAGTMFSPAVADALTVNNLAKAVAAKVCGSDKAYQNGCKVYMSLRLQEGKNPSAALSGAESVCDDFHENQPNNVARCKQGAQYLRGME